MWRIGIVAILSIVGILLLRAQTAVQIYPADGSEGGPVLVVVLADNFKSDEESAFNDAADYFINVELLTDPYYALKAGSFTVKKIFEPTTGSESNYGFTYLGTGTNCHVSWGADTEGLLVDAAAPAQGNGKEAARMIVIGNYYDSSGCAHGRWVWLGINARGHEIVRHELGHMLGGLFDEYALTVHENEDHPDPPDQLNCSRDQDPPWDTALLGPPQPACHLYGLGVFHPTPYCKMGVTKRGPFCGVCVQWMNDVFNTEANGDDLGTQAPKPPAGLRIITGAGFFGQPTPGPSPLEPPQPQPPPQPTPTRLVRVLLQLTTGTPTARVLKVTEATGPVRNNYQRRGDYVYEVSEGTNVLAIGVVTGDPFETRSYSGSAPRHGSGTAPTGTVLVTIPNETLDRLRVPQRNVEIGIYRLGRDLGSDSITPDRFSKLKGTKQATRQFRVPPDVLKAAM